MAVFPEMILRNVPARDYGIPGLTVRVDHKKSGAISSFKLLGGQESAYWEAVGMIKAYYRLDNE